ncbi:hypothetical protein Agabi119p4_2523 [Agaricus bisporus var. burnettii]|uniref:Uncharacterized protein n=1 Tax=Agaricus bisporus var. burnettii TaxID=192524 RepID=A0A8H7F9F8_AGABI|nr:hypothetical protein Agabi119p4_2523 [Agaricus bisporus var. burnettii]
MRTTDISTVRAHADLAAFKTTGYITTCEVSENINTSNGYADDKHWLIVTLVYPLHIAQQLLASPVVKTNQSVVLFTDFPCASAKITISDFIALQESRHTSAGTLVELKAHSLVAGGRPYTWNIKWVLELERCIIENKHGRTKMPTKHLLHELVELNAALLENQEPEISS